MSYEINWYFKIGMEGQKIWGIDCKLRGHSFVDSFIFEIREHNSSKSLQYRFSIKPIYSETGYLKDQLSEKFASQRLQRSNWHATLELPSNATKEQAIACSVVLFTFVNLSEQDKQKITNFLQSTMTHDQLYELILGHVKKDEIKAAFGLAQASDQQGHDGLTFRLAEVLYAKGLIHDAYVAFANVRAKDQRYVEAQIAAANLAGLSIVPFSDFKERLKAIFTHCENAGAEGQPYIDKCFLNFTQLNGSDYVIKNVKRDFETLASFAGIMAHQNAEIQRLRQQLAAYETNKNHNQSSSQAEQEQSKDEGALAIRGPGK